MTSRAVFAIQCPTCSASYPVDSAKVPAGGVRARCGGCPTIFLVEPPGVRGRGMPGSPRPSLEPRAQGGERRAWGAEPGEREGAADSAGADRGERAARLARVLVSDMISYNRNRYERALEQGTLQEDFADEVRRSWLEYVRRVGREMAHGSRYFQEELNATLARGRQLY